MNKFENVDIIACLDAIMRQNTAFYQNDFDIDKKILQKAAASPTAGIKPCYGFLVRRGRNATRSATFS